MEGLIFFSLEKVSPSLRVILHLVTNHVPGSLLEIIMNHPPYSESESYFHIFYDGEI
jgi:hypothetical protein